MALGSIIMLRRAASSSLLHRSLLAATSAVDRSLVVPLSRFSTSSDVASQPANKDLVHMLDLEIERADKNMMQNTCVVPPGFPFRIENTESEGTVILSRRYGDEIIKAQVNMGEPPNSDIEIRTDVTISKETGNTELLFETWTYSDSIDIEKLRVKKGLLDHPDHDVDVDDDDYDDDRFWDLDDELREGFHKYLDMRGINHTNINLLREKKKKMEMDPPDKKSMEFKNWLCNIKKFLA